VAGVATPPCVGEPISRGNFKVSEAAALAATGNLSGALMIFIAGELLKLVLIERLFELTRENLMRVSAFAWIYGQYVQARAWIMQSEAWQAVRSMSQSVLNRIESGET
jgi:hypothetical protein